MKNAIELKIKGIKCDNPNCDYKNPNVRFEDYNKWLNKPCPKCGENLLTQEDINTLKALLKITNTLNKILPKPKEGEKKTIGSIGMDGTGAINIKIDKIE